MIVIALFALLTAVSFYFWARERKDRRAAEVKFNPFYPDIWSEKEKMLFSVGLGAVFLFGVTATFYMHSMAEVKIINEQCGGKQFTASDYFYLGSEIKDYCADKQESNSRST